MKKKPGKLFSAIGALIGGGIWGSLAYLVYPGWSAWVFGMLMLVTLAHLTRVLLGR